MDRTGRLLVVVTLALVLPTAGCLGPDGEEPANKSPASEQTGTATPDGQAHVSNDTLHVGVDVPIVPLGFAEETTRRLDDRLEPETLEHSWGQDAGLEDLRGNASTDEVRYGARTPAPIEPTARYVVHEPRPRLESRLDARMSTLSDAGDAAAVEAFLADQLPEEGVDVDPNRPLLVLLNGSAFPNAPDNWTYEFPLGSREDLAVFGEGEPLVVVDTSQLGLDPTQPSGIEHLETLVRNATQFRLLQGNLYEVPTTSCHALTLVTAYRPSLLDDGSGDREELYDPSRVQSALDNLTHETVHVDPVVLELPQDDPELDGLTRGERYSEDALKEWLAENWGDYWVPHEGCQAYLSVLVHSGDSTPCATPYPPSTDPPGLHPHGCARTGRAHYTRQGARIALSWVNEATIPDDHEPGSLPDVIDYLHAHESGHLFGLHHPHAVYDQTTGLEIDHTFTPIWSTMSYDTGDLLVDFGTVDRANLERNTAAATIVEAHQQGLAQEPAYERALAHLDSYAWGKATDQLTPLLDVPAED